MSESKSAWLLYEEATQHLRNGDLAATVRVLTKAVREFTIAGDDSALCHALDVLASLHNDLGDFKAAEQYHTRGLEVARKLAKGQEFLTRHLDGLGVAKSNRGLWREAIATFDKALEESRRAPTVRMRELRGRILRHLGDVYARYSADWQRAVSLYDEAIFIANDLQNEMDRGLCLTFKGVCMEALGDFDDAVRLHEEARAIANLVKSDSLLATATGHLATSYSRIGKITLALKYAQETRELDEKTGNKQGLTRDYILLGQLVEEGNQEEALQFFHRGFEIAREVGDLQNTLLLVRSIGTIYQRRHQAAKAREFYEEAVLLCQKLGADKRIQIEMEIQAASVGNLDQMPDALEEQLKSIRNAGLEELERQVEETLAQYFDQKGDWVTAKDHYRRSVDLLERARTSYAAEEYLRSFSEQHARSYQRLVHLLAVTQEDLAAFDYSERSRARALASVLYRRSAGDTLTDRLWQHPRYRSICERLLALDRELETVQLDGKGLPGWLQKELERALLEETEIVLEARRSSGNPSKGELTIATVSGIQSQFAAFGGNTLLLAYFTTPDETYLFAVDQHAFELIPLGLKNDLLRSQVLKIRECLGVGETPARHARPSAGRKPKQAFDSNVQKLADQLIGPVAEWIERSDHVCIVPHGPLHYLPFQALQMGGHYLVEVRPLSYAPSVTALSFCLGRKYLPVERVLALGDPTSGLAPLPFAAAEVRAISEMLGAQCVSRIGPLATKEMLVHAGAAFDAWHVASHAVFIQSAPHLSYFQLAAEGGSDGRLYAFELAELDHPPRLVVASACQTALTKESAGDELNGLLYSLLAAGCRTVIGSLWRVSDASTAELMTALYKQQSTSDQGDLAGALQRAQIHLMQDPRTSSPYYWAPFILQGAWSPKTAIQAPHQLESVPTIVTKPERLAAVLTDRGNALLARATIEKERQPWSLLAEREIRALEEAVQSFTEALKTNDNHVAALAGRGIAYYRIRRWDEAISDLTRAAAIAPEDPRASVYLGLALSEKPGRRGDAIACFDRAFVSDPRLQVEYPKMNTYRLKSLLRSLKAEESIEEITRSANTIPLGAEQLVERGFAFQQLSYSRDSEANRQKADGDYAAALMIDPQHAVAKVRREWLHSMNYKPGAMERYKAIVQQHPDCAEARLRLAQACEYSSDPDAAISEYREALRLDPRLEGAANGLGHVLLEKGCIADAKEAFESAVRNDPNAHDPYLYLKEIYAALGQNADAQQAIVDAMRTTEHPLYEGKLGVDLSDDVVNWIRTLASRRGPGQPSTSRRELESMFHQANKSANENRNDRAIELYNRIIELDPTNALAHTYRGACRDVVGEHQGALADCEEAARLDPNCATAWFNLGVLYQRRWQLQKSQAAFDKAVMLDASLSKRLRRQENNEQSQTSVEPLERAVARAYQTSDLFCDFCRKQLRKPTGGILIYHGSDMNRILEGTPYYCSSCGKTACFGCSAAVVRGKSLCPSCGGTVTAWGHAPER